MHIYMVNKYSTFVYMYEFIYMQINTILQNCPISHFSQ